MRSRLVAAIFILELLLGFGAATPALAATNVWAVAGTEEMLGVACPTSTLCVAVGDDFSTSPPRYAIVPLAVHGSALDVGPSPAFTAPDNLVLRGIACPTDGLCLAVGAAGSAPRGVVLPLQVRGSSVIPGPILSVADVGSDDGLNRIACPTATTCVAVGSKLTPGHSPGSSEGLVAAVQVGGSQVGVGTAQELPEAAGLSDVACPTATHCLAVGSIADGLVPVPRGSVVTLNLSESLIESSLDVGPLQPVAGSNHLYAISCPTSATCLAVGDGDTGSIVASQSVDGSSVSSGVVRSMAGASSAQGIVCPRSDRCLVAGGNSVQGVIGSLDLNRGTITTEPNEAEAGASNLADLACPTVAVCLAVGNDVAPTTDGGQGVVVLVPER